MRPAWKIAMDKIINLTHMTLFQWILIVIFSGIVVAIINQLGAWIVSARQVRSQERIQDSEQTFNARLHREERENQSLQLLITAHFKQRSKSLKDAVDVRDWIWERMHREYGPEHDYYGDNEPTARLTAIADVLNALNRITYTHPTKSVRDQARGLKSNISAHFNRVNDDGTRVGGTPLEDDLVKWLDSADGIIEKIHTPPSIEEVRRPASEMARQQPPPDATIRSERRRAKRVQKHSR